MLIRFLWRLLSIIAPWLVLFIYDNPGGALVALVMQGTIIGWIPASIWAMRTVKEERIESQKSKQAPKQSRQDGS